MDYDKLDETYREEGWGRIAEAALGIRPSDVESQARTVADYAATRIAQLEALLDDARKTMRNARGAIESNQIEDKDVRRQLTQGIERIDAGRAALAKEGNGNG